MNAFRERLRDIRTTEARRARERQRLTDAELGLNDGSERFHDLRDHVVERTESLMKDFCREALGFSVHFGFYEGKYSITLSAEEYVATTAGMAKEFSRVTYLLSPHGSVGEEFECMAKSTVRNRDLRTAMCRGSMDHVERLDRFLEEQMLRFARAYFSQEAPVAAG